ncbi:hypothetical protein DYD21_07965 [Rhodohalobacter sp. SW132]|uniref:hypothetical protein n=1 Tax=Rhodohalobacter sp. SW132 TaxID=2293433 RepID=UPI000E2618D7|nr:hypothetical protein [Rhodohalobacter sp. SW132]REL37709.1 hypothetical protein DYD21_07965 [Rhodohalobacter sp. SW132]
MSITEKTRKELEQRIEKIERLIAKKGVGSGYLGKAEKAQRDLNIGLLLGATTVAMGVTAYLVYKIRKE